MAEPLTEEECAELEQTPAASAILMTERARIWARFTISALRAERDRLRGALARRRCENPVPRSDATPLAIPADCGTCEPCKARAALRTGGE
jgi:hypothetical protein